MRYYITGHRDLSKEEFSKIYIPEIDRIIQEDSNAVFLVGVCEGVDLYTIQYLNKYSIPVQVYGPNLNIGFIKPGRENSSFTALNILKRYIINKS